MERKGAGSPGCGRHAYGRQAKMLCFGWVGVVGLYTHITSHLAFLFVAGDNSKWDGLFGLPEGWFFFIFSLFLLFRVRLGRLGK